MFCSSSLSLATTDWMAISSTSKPELPEVSLSAQLVFYTGLSQNWMKNMTELERRQCWLTNNDAPSKPVLPITHLPEPAVYPGTNIEEASAAVSQEQTNQSQL